MLKEFFNPVIGTIRGNPRITYQRNIFKLVIQSHNTTRPSLCKKRLWALPPVIPSSYYPVMYIYHVSFGQQERAETSCFFRQHRLRQHCSLASCSDEQPLNRQLGLTSLLQILIYFRFPLDSRLNSFGVAKNSIRTRKMGFNHTFSSSCSKVQNSST